MPPAITLDAVTKRFGQTIAVDTLSLQVPEGTIYGFIGPNGSGKTTTLRMIMNILLPDSGTVEVLGDRSTQAARDRVGYLPEERGLYKQMPIRRLLTYYGELKGARRADVEREADGWLARLGLSHVADKKVQALSKGMSQKVQFIATVVARPALVILDEPFSGLDPVNRDVLRDAVLELKRRGTTIVFSTHDMAMAELMCDRIFMIFKGRKVLDGSLEEIQARYGHDEVHVRVQGGADRIRAIDGVQAVVDHGNVQQVRLSIDPQVFLSRLAQQTTVQRFEITRPSLHDIFVEIARPALEDESSFVA
jgi:ABC-2 type transport system ATP-binding protein